MRALTKKKTLREVFLDGDPSNVEIPKGLPPGVGLGKNEGGNGSVTWRVRLGERFLGIIGSRDEAPVPTMEAEVVPLPGGILNYLVAARPDVQIPFLPTTSPNRGNPANALPKNKKKSRAILKDFKHKEEARRWAWEQYSKRDQITATRLEPAQLNEAALAFGRIKQFPGLTLTQAVEDGIKLGRPSKGVIGWEAALALFLDDPRPAPLLPNSRKDYSGTIRNFFTDHPRAKVHEIQKDDVSDWIDEDAWTRGSQAHHLRNLKAFFAWAKRDGYVGVDPAIDIPRIDYDADCAILTPEEAADLLTKSDGPIRTATALGLFAGLRSSEIQQLDWAAVGDKEIQVSARIAKTRKNRMIAIHATLKAWLDLVPEEERVGLVAPTPWRSHFEKAREAAGFFTPEQAKEAKEKDGTVLKVWPRNPIRHSFGTYFLAATSDEARTAAMMGNSPDVILKHYRTVVKEPVWQAYWAILPGKKERSAAK
ncbi:Site-specific recombinase XerD [Verrucomicrobium sp. GAS474]|uniref:tyrosine-type recombinase/integrase n=1 Tax=Verrucomicrobium sp. GAS474 TaxID=1882831 RepID=UPI000879DA93|nr:tyrosine-type recombinase/integrase [Verrucomicrobium sp. GAS474]SDU14107.1 Site-specific recombinase XerD [Verrucomicrobium sp. GAS474]